MDESTKEIEESKSWQEDHIDPDHSVYRLAPSVWVNREKSPNGKLRVPSESIFEIKDNEAGLSLNWDKFCCEKKSILHRGLMYKKDIEEYINPNSCLVFKLPVSLLNDYGNVIHTPVFEGNPSPVGFPNNKSHCELVPSNEAAKLKMMMDLVDYCRNEQDVAFCKLDFKELQEDLEELRNQLNNTPYHKDWVFEN